MNEAEFRAFVTRLVLCGDRTSVRNSLTELMCILIREDAEDYLIDLVKELIEVDHEMAELGKNLKNRLDKNGEDVTMEELGKAIREGRERIRREAAFRC